MTGLPQPRTVALVLTTFSLAIALAACARALSVDPADPDMVRPDRARSRAERVALADSAQRLDSLGIRTWQESGADTAAHARALHLLAEAATLYERAGDRRSAGVVLHEIAFIHERLGRPDSALAYNRRALRIAREVRDLTGQGKALNAVGSVHLKGGSPDSALVYYQEALAVRRRAGDQAGEGATLSNVGTVHMYLGRPDSAIVYFQESLRIARATGDRKGESYALGNLGLLHQILGRPDSALANFRQVLQVARETEDRWSERLALGAIAGVHRALGQQDSALVYQRQELQVARAAGDRLGEGASLVGIGSSQRDLGRPDSALAYFRQAVPILREVGDRPNEARLLGNIGITHMDLGRPDSALAYQRQMLAINREVGDRPGEGAALNSIGRAHLQTGSPDSALVYYHQALRVARETGDRQSEAGRFNNIGVVYSELGQPDSALVYFRESLQLARETGARESEAGTLENIAEEYERRNAGRDLITALAYYDSAAAVQFALQGATGGDANRVSYAELSTSLFKKWTRAWVARAGADNTGPSVRAALAASERGRAQALLDLMLQGRKPLPPNEINAAPDLPPEVTERRPGADLTAEADSLLAPLRARRSAALSYILAGDTLYTWFLRPSGELELLPRRAIVRDTLEHLVRAVRAGLDADEAVRRNVLDPDEMVGDTTSTWVASGDVEGDLRRLASLLLPDDIERSLPAGADLVIVPHGAIALVPFAALPASGADPLGVRYAVRYAPSLAALGAAEARAPRLVTAPAGTGRAAPRAPANPAPRRAPQRAPAPTAAPAESRASASALVVGNPSMPTLYSGRWVNRGPLRPLPGAEAEGHQVASLLGTEALTGSEATETAVLALLPHAALVHFATHGLAYSSDARARQSFVAFTPDSINDGFLTVGEILDDPTLTLSAELVVLSACQTGLGDLRQAEGTVGLQRAFLARGARSVLVSLWSVDDAATRILMERFYAHWLSDGDRPSKAEALRRAQADLRRMPAYSHPRYWSAFQLVGAN